MGEADLFPGFEAIGLTGVLAIVGAAMVLFACSSCGAGGVHKRTMAVKKGQCWHFRQHYNSIPIRMQLTHIRMPLTFNSGLFSSPSVL